MSQMKCSKKKIFLSVLIFIVTSAFSACTVVEDEDNNSDSVDVVMEVAPAPTPEPTSTPFPTTEPIPDSETDPATAPTKEPVSESDVENIVENEFTYVLNTSSQKIHHPNCKSVAKIKPENYATTNKSLEELLDEGYTKCGNCW